VLAHLSVGSKTVTVRRSSRLRPLVRLSAASIGALVEAISWIFWFSDLLVQCRLIVLDLVCDSRFPVAFDRSGPW
jgi:hypothetical protein